MFDVTLYPSHNLDSLLKTSNVFTKISLQALCPTHWCLNELNPLSSPKEKPVYDFQTVYTIDVIKLYKGDYRETTMKIYRVGGIKGYKEKEQLELIENKKEYLFNTDKIKEINGNWSIPIYVGAPDIKIGSTYLFPIYQFSPETNCCLSGTTQALFESSNPFEKQSESNLSMKNILTELNVWDTFWVEWQKDNPKWETWLDKDEVDKILAED